MKKEGIREQLVDKYWLRPRNPLTRLAMRMCRKPITREEMIAKLKRQDAILGADE